MVGLQTHSCREKVASLSLALHVSNWNLIICSSRAQGEYKCFDCSYWQTTRLEGKVTEMQFLKDVDRSENRNLFDNKKHQQMYEYQDLKSCIPLHRALWGDCKDRPLFFTVHAIRLGIQWNLFCAWIDTQKSTKHDEKRRDFIQRWSPSSGRTDSGWNA